MPSSAKVIALPFPCFLLFRSNSLFNEVVQMNFEIASFSSLSGTQPITWQVEYPRKGTTDITLSEIYICQKDLVGIVPLAMVRNCFSMLLHPICMWSEKTYTRPQTDLQRSALCPASPFYSCIGLLAKIMPSFNGLYTSHNFSSYKLTTEERDAATLKISLRL